MGVSACYGSGHQPPNTEEEMGKKLVARDERVKCSFGVEENKSALDIRSDTNHPNSHTKEREEIWKKIVGKNKIVTTFGISKKSQEIMAAWDPRPTDVVIATPPKTGTTWLQQIVHQLRTGGDIDFEDIYQPVPWQIMAYDLGIDINADQPSYNKKVQNDKIFFPRVYKSHQRLSASPPGARFIVTFRDPAKVWSSKYRFLLTKRLPIIRKFNGMNDLKFISLLDKDMSFGASLWEYYIEYWKLREQENVLIICYEDLVIETKRFIPLIARFIGLSPPNEELVAKVLHMSSKDFMIEHTDKFNESWVHKKLVEMGRNDKPDQFLPTERVLGKAEPVNEEVEKCLQAKWEELMIKETGLKTYSAYRKEMRKITEKMFSLLGN
jgi:hypothetical protein